MGKLIVPALRAHMGDWFYYITFLKMCDIAERISIAEEIHTSASLNEYIQRRLSKRATSIKEYLLTQPQRLFNSLVIGVYGGSPRWYEVGIRDNRFLDAEDLPRYADGALGFLVLDGTEKLFAIDGQHRVAGIRQAVEQNEDIGEEEVSAIFVGHKNGREGLERTRRLFTTLNRYAKPVSKTDIIALDEDDIVAIVTRRLVEENDLFRGKISVRQTRSIPVSDKSSLTSIVVLYDVMDTHLRDRGTKAWKKFKALRPSDEKIDRFYDKSVEFWRLLAESFSPLQELRDSEPIDEVAGKYRHNQGGHLLFRPVGLLMVGKVLRLLTDSDMEFPEAVRLISQVPLEISEPPWAELLWDTVNTRMLTAPENQKVARWLLLYSVGGDLQILRTSLEKLRQEYAGILKRDQDEVEIPRYIVDTTTEV